MPIAKTAEITNPIPIESITTNPPDSISRLDVGGVPLSVYSFFSAPLTLESREVSKLKIISDWAKNEIGKEGTEGDMLTRIRQLETHLGSPSGFDKRYDKMFNYCRMTLYIREIEKRRDALTRRT